MPSGGKWWSWRPAHAQPEQCAELLIGLLRRGRRRGRQSWLWPLAVASAQSARRIDPQLRAEIDKIAEELVPPATEEAAEALAGTGEMLLRLLRAKPPRTVAEATASIRAVSAVGGRDAMTMIGEILASRGEPIDDRVAAEVLNSWRFFKPEEYLAQVLVPSWPRERELQVSESTFLAVLSQFSDLCAVRCELENFGAMSGDVSALALNQKLRSVSLAGCDADLDLSPLPRLPLLETVKLESRDEPPDLSPLSGIRGLRELFLACGTAADSLRAIARLSSLRRLVLGGCHDLSDLSDLQAPRSLANLTLSGFYNLSSLSGAERWENLKTLELFECARLSDLGPLSGMKSLEKVGIGILQISTVDLSPLAALPRLREITLMGYNAFDLTALRGKRDVVVRVPTNSTLIGAEGLGPGAAVVDFVVAPRIDIPTGGKAEWNSAGDDS